MRVHLIHGIHSTHGGNTSRLAPYFRAAGFEVMVRAYGYAFALTSGLTNWLNTRRAARLADAIKDGDAVVCHSNGAAVAWHIQAEHRMLSTAILINPALDRDTPFDNTRNVVCVHNGGDDVVAWSVLAPFSAWGAMGRDGADGSQPNITNIDAANPPLGLPRLWGHSALFEPANLTMWGMALAGVMRKHEKPMSAGCADSMTGEGSK
jgi:pimeloyl-ACP methyl ester carboxylesterase